MMDNKNLFLLLFLILYTIDLNSFTECLNVNALNTTNQNNSNNTNLTNGQFNNAHKIKQKRFIDSIPVISQMKSLVQVISGDVDGARKTQETFSKTAPVVSQVRSAVEAIGGNHEAASNTQKEFANNMGDMADGIPVVGAIKGVVHYSMGDKEKGDNSMKSQGKSAAIILGAAIGGPGGAVLGSVGYDGLTTGIESGINKEFTPNGIVNSIVNFDKAESKSGAVFDILAGLTFDALAGKGGKKNFNKLAGKLKTKVLERNNHGKVYALYPKELVPEAIASKKLNFLTGQNQLWLSEGLIRNQIKALKVPGGKSYSVLKIKFDNKFMTELKKNLIHEDVYRTIKNENLRSLYNIYTQKKVGKTNKIGIGINGQKNLNKLFENKEMIKSIKLLEPTSLKYKNKFITFLNKNFWWINPSGAYSLFPEPW